MRTGEEYREALRDGRRVWIIGEDLIGDAEDDGRSRRRGVDARRRAA